MCPNTCNLCVSPYNPGRGAAPPSAHPACVLVIYYQRRFYPSSDLPPDGPSKSRRLRRLTSSVGENGFISAVCCYSFGCEPESTQDRYVFVVKPQLEYQP